MDVLWIALIAYGISAVIYAFRMTEKYFAFFEGRIPNGTIITQGIRAGFLWPVTLLLDGVRGIWTEIAPVKAVASDPVPEPPKFDPTQPLPALADLAAQAARDNMTAQGNPNPW